MANVPTKAQEEAALNNIRQEVQAQFMKEMMTNINETCFKTCSGTKGDGLDFTEKMCLSNCVDRYMEVMSVVSKTLVEKQNR